MPETVTQPHGSPHSRSGDGRTNHASPESPQPAAASTPSHRLALQLSQFNIQQLLERAFHPSHLHQPARATSPAPLLALPWHHVAGNHTKRKLTQLTVRNFMQFEVPELPHLGATWEPGRRGREEGQDTQSEAEEDLDHPWSSTHQPTPQTQVKDAVNSPSTGSQLWSSTRQPGVG